MSHNENAVADSIGSSRRRAAVAEADEAGLAEEGGVEGGVEGWSLSLTWPIVLTRGLAFVLLGYLLRGFLDRRRRRKARVGENHGAPHGAARI